MLFLRYLSALILSVCVGGLFVGCGGGGGSSSGGGIAAGGDAAEVTVLLADGPAEEYDHLFITVTEVSLIPAEDFKKLLFANRDVSIQFVKMLAANVAEKEEQLLSLAYNRSTS